MSPIEQTIKIWKFARGRTLALLDKIAELEDPDAALMWRPGPGRAHIGWQLMHIAVTEEVFAHERLIQGTVEFPELVEKFRGGSTPDEEPISLDLIRDTLQTGRDNLLKTIKTFERTDLTIVPENLKERGWSVETVLSVIAWHEAHHQGQAHLTLNLYNQQLGD